MDLASKRKVKELLRNYNLKPIKYLGQNFLISKRALNKIIEVSNLTSSDTIIEIGAGFGTLTRELLKYVRKVIAIEKDKKLVKVLKENLKNFQNIEIWEGDVKEFFERFNFLGDYKIVSNIPYYLSSYLIRKIFELKNKPKLIILTLQAEVVRRITSKDKKSLLSILVKLYAEAKVGGSLKNTNFYPPPEVNSKILILKNIKEPTINVDKFMKIAKLGFASKRKTLFNNFKKTYPKDIIEKLFKASNINKNIRAEDLKIENWLEIYKNLD